MCSQVSEEEAHDHNGLAQEVPVQEDWNPKCPTGPPYLTDIIIENANEVFSLTT